MDFLIDRRGPAEACTLLLLFWLTYSLYVEYCQNMVFSHEGFSLWINIYIYIYIYREREREKETPKIIIILWFYTLRYQSFFRWLLCIISALLKNIKNFTKNLFPWHFSPSVGRLCFKDFLSFWRVSFQRSWLFSSFLSIMFIYRIPRDHFLRTKCVIWSHYQLCCKKIPIFVIRHFSFRIFIIPIRFLSVFFFLFLS